MAKVNETVMRETCYIAGWVIILSLVMQAVYIAIGAWNYTVILGNLLSAAVSILNFFLLGLTVQKAVEKDEKSAKNAMKASQSLRTVMLFAAAAVGALAPVFDIWASLIPLFFPRIAIAFRPLFNKKK